MSLKSFDKFCEDLILKQPGSEKVILDERQKIMRSKILIEALTIFSGLALVNCLVMDMAYQYAETYTAPLLVFMILCACYYNIRCAATDCLVGINGERSAKFSAGYCVFLGILMLIRFIFEEDYLFIANGRLTENFFILLVWILSITCGILTLVLIKIGKKSKEEG